ncbi:hsc70 cochaperone [Xylogone sp. PMI_703]|nr:hsc70 cochaperone [Xylogone sp. PMI_703]
MATTTKQRLALAIIDFLNTSLEDGTLAADDRESVEVATSCISECFKVDSSAPKDPSEQSLLQIYGVYEKLKTKTSGGAPTPDAAGAGDKPATGEPTEEQKKEADALKSKGNAAMAKKNYSEAIDLYTQALKLVPNNPIFLSNRAAAYSASRDHESAMIDAEAAVKVDPTYTKAWSRLGFARFALNDPKGSMEAYQKGIEYEGNGGSDAMKKGYETARKRVEEMEEEEGGDSTSRGAGAGAGGGGLPDLSSLASMFGGGGGGAGGGGGMPDLSSIMSNPMFASMAQNIMSNPDMMNNIMNNPRLREMANSFGGGGGGGGAGAGGGGGGMPDLASLMQDPSIAELARNMMGGGGAGRGAGRGSQ